MKEKKKPTQRAYVVERKKDEEGGAWSAIGGVWQHGDKKGATLLADKLISRAIPGRGEGGGDSDPQPTHRLYHVREVEKNGAKDEVWSVVATGWAHKDGHGINWKFEPIVMRDVDEGDKSTPEAEPNPAEIQAEDISF